MERRGVKLFVISQCLYQLLFESSLIPIALSASQVVAVEPLKYKFVV